MKAILENHLKMYSFLIDSFKKSIPKTKKFYSFFFNPYGVFFSTKKMSHYYKVH